MRKTIGDVVRKMKIGLLGLGLLVLTGGCATLYEDPLLREIGGAMPEFMQPGAYKEAQKKRKEKEENEKGIDKYDKGMRRVDDWISPPVSFTCTGYEDLNGDEGIGRDEIDYKTYFECKKKREYVLVKAGSHWDNIKGNLIVGKIMKTGTRKIMKIREWGIAESEGITIFVNFYFNKTKKDKGIKDYSLEWSVNGELMPKRTINFFIDYGETILGMKK